MTILRTEEAGGAGLGFRAEAVEFDVAENGGLDARKRKEEAGIEVGDGGGTGGLGARGLAGQMELGLNPRKRERDGERVAELGEAVDPGASGIAEAEQLGDLVVGFTGGVVEGAADERVGPGAVGGAAEIEVSMAAGDDQGQGGLEVGEVLRLPGFRSGTPPQRRRPVAGDPGTWGTRRSWVGRLTFIEEDGVDVAFEVVDGDEWQSLGEGEGFGVGDANEERSGEAGTAGDGDGVEVGEGDVGLGQGGAHDGDDGAEMLAAGQLGDDSAIAGVGGDLGGDDRGEDASAALDDGSGGLVAGGFDAEDGIRELASR